MKLSCSMNPRCTELLVDFINVRKTVLKKMIILFNLCKYNTFTKLIFKKINELYSLGWTMNMEQYVWIIPSCTVVKYENVQCFCVFFFFILNQSYTRACINKFLEQIIT